MNLASLPQSQGRWLVRYAAVRWRWRFAPPPSLAAALTPFAIVALRLPLGSSESGSAGVRCDGRPHLSLVREAKFAALFRDDEEDGRFEASDVIVDEGGVAHAVCDNSWSLYDFLATLDPFDPGSVRIGDPEDDHDAKHAGDGSDFEALFRDQRDGAFYAVRESIKVKRRAEDSSDEEKSYHAVIEELVVDGNDYVLRDQCPCEHEEGEGKGFEGAVSVRDANDQLVVLGLCEANHCDEERKSERGNGRLVAMRKRARLGDDEGFKKFECLWETVRMMKLPGSADFKDYAGITLDEVSGRVAVVSQEDSRVWVGWLDGRDGVTGLWDVGAMEFRWGDGDAAVYDFPKDNSCRTIYCNVEGVHWMNDGMLMAVSDRVKKKESGDDPCSEKDQSAHVFALPLPSSGPQPPSSGSGYGRVQAPVVAELIFWLANSILFFLIF